MSESSIEMFRALGTEVTWRSDFVLELHRCDESAWFVKNRSDHPGAFVQLTTISGVPVFSSLWDSATPSKHLPDDIRYLPLTITRSR